MVVRALCLKPYALLNYLRQRFIADFNRICDIGYGAYAAAAISITDWGIYLCDIWLFLFSLTLQISIPFPSSSKSLIFWRSVDLKPIVIMSHMSEAKVESYLKIYNTLAPASCIDTGVNFIWRIIVSLKRGKSGKFWK